MKKSVFIVDDDDLYKLLLTKTIERLDIPVNIYSFPDGKKAMEALEENKHNPDKLPDIILLDINMPVMDGWEFMEAFLHLKPELQKISKIFIASSSIALQDKEKAATYGEIYGYLEKPIGKETVQGVLND